MRSTLSPTVKALAVLVIWALGCSAAGESGPRVPEGTPVILISVDTLRSDRLPAYGYDGVETPAIDRLRNDGILFERAYTHVPLTLPAHVSLLSGVLPPAHGVRDNLGYTVDTTRTPLLQQALREAGYATGAGVSAYALRRSTGIASGFDFFDDDGEFSAVAGMVNLQSVQRPGGETLGAVRSWLRSVADRPFFLFFHTFEPHAPYEPPTEYAARYESPYDGEVAAADNVVGDLLDELRELEVYERALIVFLSDHGEDLGDHGEGEHGVFLYRSTLQVPLIVKLPRQQRAGEAVADSVRLIDVYPTVVSALGLEFGEEIEGTSLLARSRPVPEDEPIYAETFFPRLHFGWSDLGALIVGRHHFIDAPRPELYDLLEDPDEINNLLGTEPAVEAELRMKLGRYDRRLVAPDAVDPETRRRLEALGYVGDASTTEGDVLPDPKDQVRWMPDIQRAYELFHDGDLASALPALQRVLEANPKIEDAWGYLALAHMQLGRPEKAAATVLAALEQLPASRRLSLRAAILLQHMGRLDEAVVHANRAIPYDPPAAHGLLAEIALKKGDLEGAEVEARAALSSGSRQPGPRLILAEISIARGEPYRAIDLLRQSIDEGIGDEAVRAKLAMTYAWTGDTERAREVLDGFEETRNPEMLLAFGRLAMSRQAWGEAREWFERALRAAPTNPMVQLNLGLVAMAEGRLAEARKFLVEATTGNPRSYEGWSVLGMVCARQGDAEGAIAAWETARDINPGFVDVLYNLGLAYAQAGRLSEAADCFDEYVARAQPGSQRDQALAMAQQLRRQMSQNR